MSNQQVFKKKNMMVVGFMYLYDYIKVSHQVLTHPFI